MGWSTHLLIELATTLIRAAAVVGIAVAVGVVLMTTVVVLLILILIFIIVVTSIQMRASLISRDPGS